MRRGRSSSELPLRPAHNVGGPEGVTAARAKPARPLMVGVASDALAARHALAPGQLDQGAEASMRCGLARCGVALLAKLS